MRRNDLYTRGEVYPKITRREIIDIRDTKTHMIEHWFASRLEGQEACNNCRLVRPVLEEKSTDLLRRI